MMKLKICGMKHNTQKVAAIRPDYLGFIFWEPSKRFFDGRPSETSETIRKIGVFVDAPIKEVLAKIEQYKLWGVQLHGNETAEYCEALRHATVRSSTIETLKRSSKAPKEIKLKIIKVFTIKDNFDFGLLRPYENVCDYYLFDTKGELPGGNGFMFNWGVLKDYPSTKPYFLSGGIGLEEIEPIKKFLKSPESKYCHAIDVNSKFEIEPGLKNIEALKKFKEILKHN
ncbi:phosphoribosylanthranilate isomerase [Maribacter algicola]|uniref:Phosphoribosylanthranilate isomerase n=1 Tax=Meishania litoralis TaxID=3434685 RepID=A0ACC7LNI5_9FLAO